MPIGPKKLLKLVHSRKLVEGLDNGKAITFEEYQKESRKTAVYPHKFRFAYTSLGLVGEAGEVAEKMKRVFREKNGVVDETTKTELKKELGDVLWYLANIATELKLSLEDIAKGNLEKLSSRKIRGKLHGSGDNR